MRNTATLGSDLLDKEARFGECIQQVGRPCLDKDAMVSASKRNKILESLASVETIMAERQRLLSEGGLSGRCYKSRDRNIRLINTMTSETELQRSRSSDFSRAPLTL